MYEYKGIITGNESVLISRYPVEIQEKLKDRLLKAKELTINSYSYDKWIDYMEQGLEISFSSSENAEVIEIGKPNIVRLARVLVEMYDGISRKPLKKELEHDGRLETFKQYPKGTRVKVNGDIIKGN